MCSLIGESVQRRQAMSLNNAGDEIVLIDAAQVERDRFGYQTSRRRARSSISSRRDSGVFTPFWMTDSVRVTTRVDSFHTAAHATLVVVLSANLGSMTPPTIPLSVPSVYVSERGPSAD